METIAQPKKSSPQNQPNILFAFGLFFLSFIGGHLLSAISLAGKIGIGLFYSEFRFLKTWWKGSILLLFVWLVLWIVQEILQKKLKVSKFIMASVVSLVMAMSGLYYSFYDFKNSLSHRWLGERFHLGVYLFWLGWIGIILFVYLKRNLQKHIK